MIKIYLDQKDYINISNGILGDTRFKDDVECYEYLLSLVNKDKIFIYYSWAHISETLKHIDKITDSFRFKCKVLDELTKGNCLLQIHKIILKEIEYFLLEQFFNEEIDASKNDFKYAYGTRSDCIEFDIDINYARESITPELKREIKQKVLSKSKKDLNKLFPNAKSLTKKEIIKLLTFDKETVKKYFDGTLGFKELIVRYRDYFSKFGDMNDFPTSRSKQFLEIMKLHRDRIISGFEIINEKKDHNEKQKITNILKKEVSNFFSSIQEMISNQYKNEILRHINPFLKSKKIDETEALIKLSDFNDIIRVKFYKDLLTEYFNENSGFTQNPRKLDINDYYDIVHLRYLPYVDCYVTERFFGKIASKISDKYNTKVFKNMIELRSYLESVIS